MTRTGEKSRPRSRPATPRPRARRSCESTASRRVRALRILEGLRAAYPDAECALRHGSALELLAATILSAQCTDERVNMVTPTLFARFPDARALAEAASNDPGD